MSNAPTPAAEPWTIQRLLVWTTDYLKKAGSESARLDAEVLLASAQGCERIMLYTMFNDVVADDVRTRFRELVKKRGEGAPVAYLVGKREFYSLPLRVTPDVLIPRPETELVVMTAIDFLKVRGAASPEVVDVGTGSGAIALAIAKQVKNARVTALDVSPAALAVAKQNAVDLKLDSRVQLIESDLLAATEAKPTFDVIAANLPYVSQAEYEELPNDVRGFEPKLALVGGTAGSELIEKLLPQAADRLLAGGLLLLELSPMLATPVMKMLEANGNFDGIAPLKDLAGLARVIRAVRK